MFISRNKTSASFVFSDIYFSAAQIAKIFVNKDNQIFVYIQWEMKLLLIYHKKRNVIVCISAVKTWNAVDIQDFFITLILLSKEHVYCCTFRVILTLHEFLHFYYIIRQSYPSGSQQRCHLQCSGVPRANSFFNISLKMLHYFQNVIKPYSKLLCVRHWVPQIIFVSCRVPLQPKTVGKRWISPWSLLLSFLIVHQRKFDCPLQLLS